jgi:hypothetical protein
MPLRRRQLLSDGRVLLFGSRDDAMRSVRNYGVLTRRQFICGDDAR